ncbi:phage/plasmid primase, P4 family, partial [Candidatus Methanocrinis natronophilus]
MGTATGGRGGRRRVTTFLSFDRAEILRALAVYHQPGDVVELRIPKAGRARTISGYFDDFGILADSVVGLSDDRDVIKAGGVYITLHQIDDRLLSRSTNRYKKNAETATSDGDVIRLRWLPVDCDPHRPAGIPSSDEEHEAAIAKTREIRDWLIGRGWLASAFVVADSGNGAHLPVRIDLEPSGENVDLVKRCLAALDFIFSDEEVKIDLTTYNPARIWKLPGTKARKGDATEERPHRTARLLEVPEALEPVPRDRLEALARLLPRDEPAKGYPQGGDDFDPGAWTEDHGLKVSRVKGWAGGVLAELEVCPFNPDHRRTARIGRLPSGARYFGCFHDGCRGNDWRSLRNLLEPDRVRALTPAAQRDAELTAAPEAAAVFHLSSFGDYDENGRFCFSRAKAARSISDKMDLAMETIGGDIHLFNGQVYVPTGEVTISNTLYSVGGDHVTRFTVKEVLDRLRAEYGLTLVRFNPDPYLLGVRNGVIDLRTGEFRDYRPDDLLTDRIDVAYDPAAKCPRFLRFLEEVQPNVIDRLTLVDWFPATAIRKPLPYVIFLLGIGRNGKGVYERLMKRFFGDESCSSMMLDEIKRTVFAAGALHNKRLWIASEQQGSKKKASIGTSFIKLVSGAGTVDADVKNRARIRFEAFFQTVVDTNTMPPIEDTSRGWMERFCKQSLPFIFVDDPDPDNPLERQKDPHLLDKLTTDEELSGILNLLIWRAREICETERIIKRPASDLFDEYTRQSASLSTFWDEFCDYDPGTPSLQIPTADIYEAYKRWCSHLVGEVVSENWFGAYLKRQCGGIDPKRRMVNRQRARYYPGLLFDKDKLDAAVESLDSERTTPAHHCPSITQQHITGTNINKDSCPTCPTNLWDYIIERFGSSPVDKREISLSLGDFSQIGRFVGYIGQTDNKRSSSENPDGQVLGFVGQNDGHDEEKDGEKETCDSSGAVYVSISEEMAEARRREAEKAAKFVTPMPKPSESNDDHRPHPIWHEGDPIPRYEGYGSSGKGGILYQPGGPAFEYSPWAINVAKSCSFGCCYCFAPPLMNKTKAYFHCIPDPKKNILQSIHRGMKKALAAGCRIDRVHLTFVGDFYDPASWNKDEFASHEEQTRAIIEAIHSHGVGIQVLTKSGMAATRDFDLYRPGDWFGVTITTWDPDEVSEWEKKAASTADRMEALAVAHSMGISTYVSLEPVISAAGALEAIRQTHQYVDRYMVGKMTADSRNENRDKMKSTIKSVDWRKFTAEMVALMDELGCDYYVKDSLQQFLPDGHPDESSPPKKRGILPPPGEDDGLIFNLSMTFWRDLDRRHNGLKVRDLMEELGYASDKAAMALDLLRRRGWVEDGEGRL